jgi:hypothetical protein
MTRGQKGCFVFSVDAETNAWLKAQAAGAHGPAGGMLMAAEAPGEYESPQDDG